MVKTVQIFCFALFAGPFLAAPIASLYLTRCIVSEDTANKDYSAQHDEIMATRGEAWAINSGGGNENGHGGPRVTKRGEVSAAESNAALGGGNPWHD